MFTLIAWIAAEIRRRWRLARACGDAGYITEAVLVTALLVALAVLVVAIIAAKVLKKANGIEL